MDSTGIRYPGPKEIVLALMKFDGREERFVNGVKEMYLKYCCHHLDCKTGFVSFIESNGFKTRTAT